MMGVVIAILLCLLATGIYKSFTRSKSRTPPGPRSLPLLGSLLSLRQPLHRHFAALGIRYGPFVFLKIGMVPYVVANTARAAEMILKFHDTDFANRSQSEEFFRILSFDWSDLAFSPQGPRWKHMRKICTTHLFSNLTLGSSAHHRRSQIQAAVASILENWRDSKHVNLRAIFGEIISSSLCLVLFNQKRVEVVDLLDSLAQLAINLNIGEIIPPLDRLDLHGVYAKMKKDIMPRLRSLVSDQIQEHRRRKTAAGDKFESRDFVDILISLDDNDKISDEETMALICDMVIAGVQTSKETVEWCMAEVISNPEIMLKAQEELDAVVGRERLVQESDLPKLPFIQAILKESFRLHPVVPLGVPHFNLHPIKLDDHITIPAKCKILINIWAIGRDPAHWTHPDEFKPDRFLGSSISTGGQHYQLIPFSAGRRMCVGSSMATRIVTFIMATLLQAFHWRQIQEHPIVLEELIGTISCPLISDLVVDAAPRINERLLAQCAI